MTAPTLPSVPPPSDLAARTTFVRDHVLGFGSTTLWQALVPVLVDLPDDVLEFVAREVVFVLVEGGAGWTTRGHLQDQYGRQRSRKVVLGDVSRYLVGHELAHAKYTHETQEPEGPVVCCQGELDVRAHFAEVDFDVANRYEAEEARADKQAAVWRG